MNDDVKPPSFAVPLYEQLEKVPLDARLVIEDSDGMGAQIFAIGRMCHGAAAALRAAIKHAERPMTHSRDCWKWHHGCAVKKIERAEKQEPVAWMYVNTDGECEQIEYSKNCPIPDDPSITPLYTAPRQWQGLTDEEVSEILDREIGFNSCFGPETNFARAIEAKLKEKNT